MKKQIFKALLVLAVIGSASTAMAGSISGTTIIGAGNTFTPSTKVGIQIVSATISYAAQSCHINGTKQYGTVGGTGTSQDVSKIYYQDIPSQASNTTGVGIPSTPDSATALNTTGTWSN